MLCNNTDMFLVFPITVAKFLRHVGFGEQNEAEDMLKINKSLATAYGDLTDCADKNFKKITGFQYAVLSLDYHMWTMIKKYLTKEDICNQLKEVIRVAMLHEQKGWTMLSEINIESDWQPISWFPLINALETYVKHYDSWNGEQCSNYWCQQIGYAQLILPAHVISEYSYPSRPFYPSPNWNEEATLPRIGVADWRVASGCKLGSDFAWLRAERIEGRKACTDVNDLMAQCDFVALSKLLKSRKEQAQLLLLEYELNFKPINSVRPMFKN